MRSARHITRIKERYHIVIPARVPDPVLALFGVEPLTWTVPPTLLH